MSWQSVIDEWSEKLSHLKITGEFSDVTLVVGKGGVKRKFKAHRTILAMHSEVMEDMLYSSNTEEEVLLEDDPQCFEIMMRFAYCQDVKLFAAEDAIGTYHLADKYIIFPLKDKCLHHLRKNISSDNVLQVYKMATEIGESYLQLKSWRFIARNAAAVLSSTSFPGIHESLLFRILTEPFLTIDSEAAIFKALCSWGRSECERRGQLNTAENVRSVLTNYLSEVRFLTLTADEFEAGLHDSKILTDSEKLNILLNIVKPGAVLLPQNWSQSKEKRAPFPTDQKWLSYQRRSETSFSQIEGFPRVTESFEVSHDICMFGVGFYVSLSSKRLVLPKEGYITLSVHKARSQETFEEAFPMGSISFTDDVELMLETPIYVRRGEICKVSLEENFKSTYTFFYCNADCCRNTYPFVSEQKNRRYHFHEIHAAPM